MPNQIPVRTFGLILQDLARPPWKRFEFRRRYADLPREAALA